MYAARVSATWSPDFVVLAPLEEERDAVLGLLPAVWRLPPDAQDIRIYYGAELPVWLADGTEGVYRLIVASPLGSGRVEAAAATSDAIHRFRPRYVLLVGIAEGVSDGVEPGDVLVADQFVDYEQQKLTAHGAQIRYQAYRAAPRLLIASQHLRDWQKTVTATRPDAGHSRRHLGPIVCGDKIFATRSGLHAYLQDWPRLIGIETESARVASAAFQAASQPGVLMIRGVAAAADAHDPGTGALAWRRYACEVAAAYTLALLRSGPVPLVAPLPVEEDDPYQITRQELAWQVADSLQISADAGELIAEKPRFWEYKLFGRVLSDELANLAYLLRDFQLGIGHGPRVYLEEVTDLTSHALAQLQELKPLFEAVEALLGKALLQAVGPPGEEGDADGLVYVAKRLADIYQKALEWALQWLGYEVDDNNKKLLALTSQLSLSIVEGIQSCRDQFETFVEKLNHLNEGEKITLELDVKVAIGPQLISQFDEETKRLTRRRSFKFW